MTKYSPILITGIARSGGSMIAGAVNVCGAFGGHMAISGDNKRGMFENIRIKEGLVKPYLISLNCDPEGQYPLLTVPVVSKNWGRLVDKAMEADGYTDGPWMYKDSRMGLMWKTWSYAYPDAKWVIVRRRTGDVIQSCIKTGFMKAFKDEEKRNSINVQTEEQGWLWWVHQHEKCFVEMITEGLNCKVVWPERMLYKDYKQLCELIEWLGLEWKEEALCFIDSLLWGNKQKERRTI